MKAVSARVSPWLYFCALGISAVLIGCGGPGGAKTLSLTGTAATGAAIASAPVEAKCATANATTTTAADGTFTLTSTTATLPCLLRITLPNGAGYLHSVAESGASVANITPLTEIVAANVLGASPSVLFSSFASSDAAGITSAKIAAAKAVVIAVATKAGIDLTGADPLKDVFVAATPSATGDAKDRKIDAFMAYIGSAGITLQALSAQTATSKSAADALSTMTRMTAPQMALFAGNLSGPGSADGTGAEASFNSPQGIAVDASGNVYVADTYNHTIRKITSAGVVTTLAGTAGVCDSADGTGAAASFCYPSGVAVDASGNVYVADTYNSTVRKITSAGVVTTLAGTPGASTSADGTGAAANFNYLDDVAVDASGNVYVADTYNHTIRKITSAGVVTTFAGIAGVSGNSDGTGAAASFYYPIGDAVDASGNVYVADTFNNTIRTITPAGVVTTLAGSAGVTGSADGTGAAASFSRPIYVAVDASGTVYVADQNNITIRKITSAGVVTTLAGTAGVQGLQMGALPGVLNPPNGIAVTPTAIYFTMSNGVVKIPL